MRIVGYIEDPQLKITLFEMDNRLSVKFETGLYEQTYKFRKGDLIKTAEDIKKVVTSAFKAKVLAQFNQMHQLKNESVIETLANPAEGSFEEII